MTEALVYDRIKSEVSDMRERKEVIEFCMTLPDAEEAYPFDDTNWTVMRHKRNKKMFASICYRLGNIWVNVKCDPNLALMWRDAFPSVVPAYHMNKLHWNSLILDGTIPTDAIKNMIYDSYDLIKPKKSVL